jgi:hypothetical protein
MKTTGFDSAWMVPVGATVTRVYWCVAETYGPGAEQPDQAAAVTAGLHRHDERVEAYREQQGAGADIWPYPDHGFSVDLRWTMKYPGGSGGVGGGIDATVTRHTFESTAEAREWLARHEKYHAEVTP